MAYTTQAKVESMFRSIDIASGAVVTPDELSEFIARADAEIDAKLYTYYETPITGATSLLIVEEISTLLVAHRIKTILELTNQISDLEQDVQTNLEKRANSLLKQLIPVWNAKANRYDPPIMPLPDATAKAFSPENGSIFKSHTTNQTTSTVTFHKGEDNW